MCIRDSRDEHEDDRQCDEEDLQRDLVGRLFAVCAFDHGDHFIEEAAAGLLRDADDEPV